MIYYFTTGHNKNIHHKLKSNNLKVNRNITNKWIRGKNTRKIPLIQSESESCSVVSDSLRPHGLYSPWNSPGQNTGVGSLSLLQGIFPTQGLNPSLPHSRQILYQLSHKGSPIYAKLFLKWGISVKPFVYTARTTWTVKVRKEKFFNNLFLSSLENLIC